MARPEECYIVRMRTGSATGLKETGPQYLAVVAICIHMHTFSSHFVVVGS